MLYLHTAWDAKIYIIKKKNIIHPHNTFQVHIKILLLLWGSHRFNQINNIVNILLAKACVCLSNDHSQFSLNLIKRHWMSFIGIPLLRSNPACSQPVIYGKRPLPSPQRLRSVLTCTKKRHPFQQDHSCIGWLILQ